MLQPVAPSELARLGQAVIEQVSGVVLGKRPAVTLAVAAMLAGGHVLVEDLPGVGKTSLAKALAASIGGTVGRIQGTPDLLPGDISGFSVFNPQNGEWVFRPGPIFNQVVLFDEINRATPRAQSALLEAMAEIQVTVDGTIRSLPEGFFVLATQNPHSDVGTFPLSAGQRDRFAVVLELGLPDREAERAVVLGRGGPAAAAGLRPLLSPAQLATAAAALDRVHVAPVLVDYVLDLVEATRRHPGVRVGASPRGSHMLLRMARALALLDGRDYLLPDDVQALAPAVLAHRIELATGLDQVPAGRRVIGEIVAGIPVPLP